MSSQRQITRSPNLRPSARRGRLLVIGVGVICVLIPVYLATTEALDVQVAAAAAGALMTTAGLAVVRAVWSSWRESDLRRLVGSLAFFLSCAGVVLLLAGVGLYH